MGGSVRGNASCQGLPPSRQHFGQPVMRVGGDAGRDVPQVGKGLDAVALAGGRDAEHDRGGAASVV